MHDLFLGAYTLDEITYVPFPAVGTTLNVVINHFHREHGFFMAAPLDEDALNKAAEMPPLLEAHAANSQPFRPASNELCIAKWTGKCDFKITYLIQYYMFT